MVANSEQLERMTRKLENDGECQTQLTYVGGLPVLVVHLRHDWVDDPVMPGDPVARLCLQVFDVGLGLSYLEIDPKYAPLAFRCVDIGRLQTILTNGVDVSPPSAPIYAAWDVMKALEFGGNPKVLQIFHANMLRDFDYTKHPYKCRPARKPFDALALVVILAYGGMAIPVSDLLPSVQETRK